ncbi:MAG: DinB family protein [Ignavibacteria bacterium]|nr:DinB family protein [Ignavibacteria bacterium]
MENKTSQYFAQQFEMVTEWINWLLKDLTDEDLRTELSPGKNHGIWILGHLIASDDDFSLFMGTGNPVYPEIQELFGQGSKLQPPDKYPDVKSLRVKWDEICEKNRKIYSELKDEDFDKPHAMIKNYDTDYFKTKGRVIMAWQIHQAYHAGQLAVIASLSGKSRY